MGRRIRALILVAALIAAGVFAGSALSNWWSVPGADAAVATAHRALGPSERVRVEVLNAAGKPNLARQATDALRDEGFDVVYFGNAAAGARSGSSTGRPAAASTGDAPAEPQPSVVLDRVGRVDLARSVADALGIREVRSEPDANLYVDVSVRLGEDWTKPAPVAAAPAAPAPKWWDVRRFLRRAPRPAPAPGATLADPAAARSGSASDK